MGLDQPITVMCSLAITCFVVALMGAEEMTEETHFVISPLCALIVVSVLQVTAVIYMEISCAKNTRKKLQSGSETEGRIAVLAKTFGGLWVFGGGAMVMDTILVIYAGVSFHDSLTVSSITCRVQLFFLLIFHVVKIVFTLGQIHFLQHAFHHVVTTPRKGPICLIIGVNTLVWLFSFQFDAKTLRAYYYALDDDKQFPETITNSSDDCLPTNSSWAKTAESWRQYLQPFTMEFSFVAVELIYSVLMSSLEPTATELSTVSCSKETVTPDALVSEDPPSNYNSDESVPLFATAGSNNLVARRCCSFWKTFPAQAFKISVVFLIVYVGVSFLYYYGVQIRSRSLSDAFSVFQMLLAALSIYLCTVALSTIKSHSNAKSLLTHASVLLSSTGLLVIDFFNLIAGVCAVVKSESLESLPECATSPWFVVVEYNIYILDTVFQCALFFKFSQKDHLLSLEEHEKNLLKNCFKFLSLRNAAIWTIDSFCTFHHYGRSHPVLLVVFGTRWIYVNLFIFPVVVFYRFQMAESFFKLVHFE